MQEIRVIGFFFENMITLEVRSANIFYEQLFHAIYLFQYKYNFNTKFLIFIWQFEGGGGGNFRLKRCTTNTEKKYFPNGQANKENRGFK